MVPTEDEIFDAVASKIGKTRSAHSRIMLYGNSGCGKTVLAMKMAQAFTPPDKEILIVDTSNGWVSIPNHPELDYRYEVLPYVSREQVMAIGRAIKAGHPKFERFGAVIVDEISTVADDDLLGLVENRAKVDKTKDPDTVTWPDRDAGDNRMKKMMQDLTGPFHLITVAHEREYKNKKKQSCTGPSFADALREKMKRTMHGVWYVQSVLIEGQEQTEEAIFRRIVQCHGSQAVDAKSRVSGLKVHEDFDSLVEKAYKWLSQGGKLVDPIPRVTLPTEIEDAIEI
jgi:energy-coupling factor transporter ATP-binding protein EcfA2